MLSVDGEEGNHTATYPRAVSQPTQDQVQENWGPSPTPRIQASQRSVLPSLCLPAQKILWITESMKDLVFCWREDQTTETSLPGLVRDVFFRAARSSCLLLCSMGIGLCNFQSLPPRKGGIFVCRSRTYGRGLVQVGDFFPQKAQIRIGCLRWLEELAGKRIYGE